MRNPESRYGLYFTEENKVISFDIENLTSAHLDDLVFYAFVGVRLPQNEKDFSEKT